MYDYSFLKTLKNCETAFDANGAKYSAFLSGGKINCVVFPKCESSLCEVISECNLRGVPYKIIGLGANTLISDEEVEEVIICTKKLTGIGVVSQQNNSVMVRALCGEKISSLIAFATRNGLSGLEWASGLPSTVGAAVYNNIGAYGYQFSDVFSSATVYSDGEMIDFSLKDINFGYRTSAIKQSQNKIITSATVKLYKKDRAEIEKTNWEYLLKRRSTQPKEPSLGCAFLRFGDKSIAPYVQALGLKGKTFGGAKVSEVHSGFIVNCGSAISSDYLTLCDVIQKKVYRKYGILFLAEFEYLGKPDERYLRLSGRRVKH